MSSGVKEFDYQHLPKVELHLHLDCSLSYEVVRKIDKSITEEAYQRDFVLPSKCRDLVDYISKANRCCDIMQTKESLRLVTLDVFNQLKNDNVVYAELRYAPLEHTRDGLTAEEVVRCVSDATAEAKKLTGIEGGIILCTLRHFTEAQSLETVKLVEAYIDHEVVGFDIAADEAGFPVDNHIKAFHFANERGIPCTAHAGESRGPDSIWETLEHFRPSRIGHGVRSVEDDGLIEHLKANDIHLEVCPSSNVQTNVYDKISDHPVNKIYDAGVSLSINTDAMSISGTTLSKEYKMLEEQFNWQMAQIRKCNLEAIEHAFTNKEVKEKVKNTLMKAYDPLV